MKCKCGNQSAYRISYSSSGESCDRCGKLGSFTFSDVFFDQRKGAHFIPNLADPNKSQMGTLVTSRSHKAQVMRELGVKESGDRTHGAR